MGVCTNTYNDSALAYSYGPFSSFSYRATCWLDAISFTYGGPNGPTVTYGGNGGGTASPHTVSPSDPVIRVDIGADVTDGSGGRFIQWIRFWKQSGSAVSTPSSTGCFSTRDTPQFSYEPSTPGNILFVSFS